MHDPIYIYGDQIGCVGYIGHMGTDLTIVNSARVSFGHTKREIDNKDKKLIHYLIKNKHTSTFEHNVVTFKFVVPLFVRSQHHRHRTWSYNEISRRYTDRDLRFYEPVSFRTQHKSNRQASNENELINPLISYKHPEAINEGLMAADKIIKKHHHESIILYDKLLEGGICREQARGILPQNLYTEYYGTTNLNNLLKFIDLRLHPHAQWEIQKVAAATLNIAENLWPIAVQSYRKLKQARQ